MAHIDKDTVLNSLYSGGVLPLFYHDDAAVAIEVLKASYRAGLRVFEFTNRGGSALATFEQLVAYAHEHLPDMAMGIGTIYDDESANKFIYAGADFVVTPALNPAVGTACAAAEVPWLPGVMTVTEIYNARQAGAEVVKLFPGEVLGSGFLKAVRGPMADLKIMVTGGVKPTRESFAEWFGAGAYCVGMGSHLFPKDVLARQDYDWVERKIAECLGFVKELRA
ncbi:bifunctional 4-hydroxy-2-oxoglutarate aldolase/2-dehydro-3-deoxy-phosphogluconate aldolase [Persicitalea jodogahamensis]|uniref:Bifunctional 4-hydroxy-2-oxoglutarate aldolase/2-dehydro-3-deoxy-phosphogluconate aldolase n=1 Tax=Persicitalea jodogahamensis TaxID=402147 RepID=A0A8J3D5A9_9BACT|nr:bifunctional 4-hydroxy-2-oxoglutarate aldolase/2-dehydro-3-deoxy-phosphogluconate aldolase [Persicitalea jodogahamensis]GHB55240.1 bifunctional 4-hydroxy-2-oxoglutarate aldolase/2-dehydro-3-deoxy-phosphogluconate aldolase [Persicitalea jodogahamensis]